ncbi:uracil-DNA glycosylase [Kosmotoga arenicorallina S304]|uniref:Type-4 uracil-DNA glycosylase n=1 Tax=Kosmotoga arenicorallina S304 TaxID=1453497 RepID=A0A176JXN9_9BACT|nr:uracil-DNA glycosylase [Kosmotoga arenicorallina]OAA28483.1 uracil-DNA glycosylase [Kosmotoga arenicorallina S304]
MTEYVRRKEIMIAISRKIEECTACPLSMERTNAVPGEGSLDSPVVFVGEGPGADEDASGRPFVGRAGQLLTKILESVNLSREDVYITNIVKCRPPKNRVPTYEEMKSCSPFLLSQLSVIKPKLIVALGATALSFFLENEKVAITKYRGQLFDWYPGTKVFAMFHPSYLLRNPSRTPGSPKYLTWEDIKKVRKMYDQALKGEEISI